MNINDLKRIFDENKDKRICVLGTTCTGKSTLIRELNIGVDKKLMKWRQSYNEINNG